MGDAFPSSSFHGLGPLDLRPDPQTLNKASPKPNKSEQKDSSSRGGGFRASGASKAQALAIF